MEKNISHLIQARDIIGSSYGRLTSKTPRKALIDLYPWIEGGLSIESGWALAFGAELFQDIDDILRSQFDDVSHFQTYTKEKYGSMRFYIDAIGDYDWGDEDFERYHEKTSQLLENMFLLYEDFSFCTCILCGETDDIRTTEQWIAPYCRSCFLSGTMSSEEIWDRMPRESMKHCISTFLDGSSKDSLTMCKESMRVCGINHLHALDVDDRYSKEHRKAYYL